MNKKTIVLLDNSVIDRVLSYFKGTHFQLAITARTNHVNPEYKKKYPTLVVVPNIARLDHSFFDVGEVFGDENSVMISNKLLSLAANQNSVKEVGKQTNFNQRDDADIIVAAYINKCRYLVSDDKKFMLKDNVKELMRGYGLEIISSDEFKNIIMAKQ